MEKCPVCENYCVVYEEYYGRKICLRRDCGWIEPINKKNDENRQHEEKFKEDLLPYLSHKDIESEKNKFETIHC